MEFNVKEEQISVSGLNINYKIIGDGNIPIILLHGWGVDSNKYIETANELARFTIYDLRFTIFIPDLPGFGKSGNPPEVWGVSDYAEWLKNYAMALNLSNLILIGHSFGGRIAIKLAAKYPEKLKALILTGAAGIKHPPTLKQKVFYALAKQGKAVFSLPILNYLRKPAQKLLYKAAREKDYYGASGIMKEIFKKVIAEDLTPYLEKIITPTLLVWGAHDKSTSLADGKIMNLKIKNSEMKIIDDANHSLPYQKPEAFVKIIADFIRF